MNPHKLKKFRPNKDPDYFYYTCEICGIYAWSSLEQFVSYSAMPKEIVDQIYKETKTTTSISKKVSLAHHNVYIDDKFYVIEVISRKLVRITSMVECKYSVEELLTKDIIE